MRGFVYFLLALAAIVVACILVYYLGPKLILFVLWLLNVILGFVADVIFIMILRPFVNFVFHTKTGNCVGAALIAAIAWWQAIAWWPWTPLFALGMGVFGFLVLRSERRRWERLQEHSRKRSQRS